MINLGFIIVSALGVILAFIVAMGFLKAYRNNYQHQIDKSYVKDHDAYILILNFYMEKAFDIIYKDRMLVYSIEGTKPDDHLIKQNSIDFAKLTMKLLGPRLTKEFCYLYGDEDTFIFSVVEFFNTKSEDDEIKQASIDQLMDGSKNEII